MKTTRQTAIAMLRAIFTRRELLEISNNIGGYAIMQAEIGNKYNAKDAWKARELFSEAYKEERDQIDHSEALI